MVDKKKAVVCCLLATSAIMLSEKKKRKVQLTICTLQWTQGSPFFYSFWKVECLEMTPSWRRQVNWRNCGIPWVNRAVLCMNDDWKRQLWGLRYCLSKLRSLLSFPSGMTSHSKIAQFHWEGIVPLRRLRPAGSSRAPPCVTSRAPSVQNHLSQCAAFLHSLLGVLDIFAPMVCIPTTPLFWTLHVFIH